MPRITHDSDKDANLHTSWSFALLVLLLAAFAFGCMACKPCPCLNPEGSLRKTFGGKP